MLSFASSELECSEADVVNYVVCHNTRKAISNLLRSFLRTQGLPGEDLPVKVLMEQCRAIDGRFVSLDISALECKAYTVGQNDCFCFDLSQARQCVELAWKIEGFVSKLEGGLSTADANRQTGLRSPQADAIL